MVVIARFSAAAMGADQSKSGGNSIPAELDALPVTPLHIAVVVICALGLLFDVVEAGLSNALSAVFSAPPHRVQPHELSLLLASVFAGGAIGAPLFGIIADRYGRRVTLAGTLFLLASASAIAATATDVAWLTAFRLLSGFSLGAYPALVTAYLADMLPPARRGMLTLFTAALGFLGAPAVVFLIRWLTPLHPLGFDGWRWALAIGAIGSAIAGALFFALPESPRWLAAKGREAEARKALARFTGGRALAAPPAAPAAPRVAPMSFWRDPDPRYRLRALLVGTMQSLGPWATIGFPLLIGAVMVEKGFRVSDSLLYVGVAMLGPSIGVLAGAFFIDRVERRITLAACAGSMAALGIAFAISTDGVALMALGLAFNLIGAIYISTLSLYDAEMFPTRLRASVSSAVWAANRVSSAFVPLALLPLLKSFGSLAMFGVIAAVLLCNATLVLTFGPQGISRKPVE